MMGRGLTVIRCVGWGWIIIHKLFLQGDETKFDKSKKYETNQNSIDDTEVASKDVDVDIEERGEGKEESVRRAEEGEVKVDDESDDYVFPVAKTKLGMLLGRIEESRAGNRILAFRGIRHVQPPIGQLRFKPPVATPGWDGIVEAKTNGAVCPQHLGNKPDIWVGSEDCLWLNVFTRWVVLRYRYSLPVLYHSNAASAGSNNCLFSSIVGILLLKGVGLLLFGSMVEASLEVQQQNMIRITFLTRILFL